MLFLNDMLHILQLVFCRNSFLHALGCSCLVVWPYFSCKLVIHCKQIKVSAPQLSPFGCYFAEHPRLYVVMNTFSFCLSEANFQSGIELSKLTKKEAINTGWPSSFCGNGPKDSSFFLWGPAKMIILIINTPLNCVFPSAKLGQKVVFGAPCCVWDKL